MIIFDTETTSLDSKSGQIAQLSYIKIDEIQNTETLVLKFQCFSYFIN